MKTVKINSLSILLLLLITSLYSSSIWANKYLGEVFLVTSPFCPSDYSVNADGRMLEIKNHKALFGLFGYTYGQSQDKSRFAIPNLVGRGVLGSGKGEGLPQYKLGQTISIKAEDKKNQQGTLSLLYCVAVRGFYPRRP